MLVIHRTQKKMMKMRTYSELCRFRSFEDRYNYLKLAGRVGATTFGYDRWANQRFYTSYEWRQVRNHVILRDNGCDLGVEGYEIGDGYLRIHHMNLVSLGAIQHGDDSILNPEYLITVSLQTHNAIHYGDESQLPRGPIVRRPGDTRLWTRRQ